MAPSLLQSIVLSAISMTMASAVFYHFNFNLQAYMEPLKVRLAQQQQRTMWGCAHVPPSAVVARYSTLGVLTGANHEQRIHCCQPCSHQHHRCRTLAAGRLAPRRRAVSRVAL
jgi:hypothetical protein